MGQEIILFADAIPFRVMSARSNLNFPEHHALLVANDRGCHGGVWPGRAIDQERFDPNSIEPAEIDPIARRVGPWRLLELHDFVGKFRSTVPDHRRPLGSCRETPSP